MGPMQEDQSPKSKTIIEVKIITCWVWRSLKTLSCFCSWSTFSPSSGLSALIVIASSAMAAVSAFWSPAIVFLLGRRWNILSCKPPILFKVLWNEDTSLLAFSLCRVGYKQNMTHDQPTWEEPLPEHGRVQLSCLAVLLLSHNSQPPELKYITPLLKKQRSSLVVLCFSVDVCTYILATE